MTIQVPIDNPGIGEWTCTSTSAASTSDPGAGNWQKNAGDTRIDISYASGNGHDESTSFSTLTSGSVIYLRSSGESRTYVVTGVTDRTTYYDIAVTLDSSSTGWSLNVGDVHSIALVANASASAPEGTDIKSTGVLGSYVLTADGDDTSSWQPSGAPSAHDLAGPSHNSATLADFNLKISDANLDAAGTARPPTSHASTHENGNADEISVAGLSGLLADPQTPLAHAYDSHTGAVPAADLPAATTTTQGAVELATDGESVSGVAVQGNDARLSDARTPTLHASSHQNGNADELNVAGLSGQLADPQLVTIQEDSVGEGTAHTLNFTTNLNVAVAGGVATIDASGIGGGDVSFTTGTVADNQIARYDTNGNQVQGGTNQPTIDDSGNIVMVGTSTVDGVDVSEHAADGTIHFTEGSIDHANIQNVGTNTHAQIDTHLGLTNEHIDWTADQGATNIATANIDVGTGAGQVAAGNHNHTGVYDPAGTAAAAVTAHEGAASAHDAANVDYDNATSGLTAANVQAAIDELDGLLGTGSGHIIEENGVDLAQRDTINFTSGLIAEDDVPNSKTIVRMVDTIYGGLNSILTDGQLASFEFNSAVPTDPTNGADPPEATIENRFYWNTTAKTLWRDTGAAWEQITIPTATLGQALSDIAAIEAKTDLITIFNAIDLDTVGNKLANVTTISAAAATLLNDASTSAMRTTLQLGSAATQNVGTDIDNVVQLVDVGGSPKLPAIDGSQLTGITSSGGGVLKVRCATTANITIATALNSGDTIDGVTLANGDRVLVKNQTTATENGIYVAGVTPARASDFDTGATVAAELIVVKEGTVNADTFWLVTNDDGSDVVGTDTLTITQSALSGVIDAGQITTGTFDNARISEGNVTQHEAALDHDNLANVDAHNTGDRHRVINEGTEALRSIDFPPASHAGEYHVTTDTGIMTRSNGTAWVRIIGGYGATTSKGATVLSPATDGTPYVLFYTGDAAIEWTSVDVAVLGSTPDIDWDIYYGDYADITGTADGTVASGNDLTGSATDATTGTIPADKWVWVEITNATGTIDSFSATIHHETAAGTGSTTAEALATTGADVEVSGAAPPTAGQVLQATSATVAAWGAAPTSHLGVGVWKIGAFTNGAPAYGNIRFNTSIKGTTTSCNIYYAPILGLGPAYSSIANAARCFRPGMVLHFWKYNDAANSSSAYLINSVTEDAINDSVTLSLMSIGAPVATNWVAGDDYVLSLSGSAKSTTFQHYEATDASSNSNSIVPNNFNAFDAGSYLMRVSGNVTAISGGTLTLRITHNVTTVVRSVDVTGTGWFEFEAAWMHPGGQPINFTHQMSAGQTATITDVAIQLRTITPAWA